VKWIALALLLGGAAASVGAAVWANARDRFRDAGFTPWLALLLAGLAATIAGTVWLLVLGFMRL
jgi:hypothetical protein